MPKTAHNFQGEATPVKSREGQSPLSTGWRFMFYTLLLGTSSLCRTSSGFSWWVSSMRWVKTETEQQRKLSSHLTGEAIFSQVRTGFLSDSLQLQIWQHSLPWSSFSCKLRPAACSAVIQPLKLVCTLLCDYVHRNVLLFPFTEQSVKLCISTPEG